MAELNMTVKHGQTPEQARANFEKAITQAQAQGGRWVRRVEWLADRTSALLTGPGFQVTLRVDDESVHATGHVPLPVKLLEGPVRRFVERTLGKDALPR
jgi:hypothetical protein